MFDSGVLATVQEGLAPYLGPNFARTSVTAMCEKLGIDAPDLTPEQLEALLNKLAAAMKVFVGNEKTAQIFEDIRRRVSKGDRP